MKNLLSPLCGLLIGVIASTPPAAHAQETSRADTKRQMIDQVEAWVAADQDVKRSRIRVGALDRRLIVPPCAENFGISYPFASSTESLRIDCATTGWKAFIRVKVESASQNFVYRQDLEADHSLQPGDIELTVSKGRHQGLIAKPEEIDNHSLKKAVRAGELVRRQHLSASVRVFRLRADVLSGESLTADKVAKIVKSITRTTMAERFPARLLKGAVAARDLAAGQVLQKRDIKQRHRALIAQTTLTRGQLLSSGNALIEEYFGRLPADALVSDSNLDQLEVTRTIQAGNLLRMSDVKVAALIKKGDMVTLSVGGGPLLITVSMQALEGGKLGEQVQLLNPESGDTVEAIVSGTRKARGL